VSDELQTICTFQQTTSKKVDSKHAANGTGSSDDRNADRHAESMRKVLPYVKGYKLSTKTSLTLGRRKVTTRDYYLRGMAEQISCPTLANIL